MLRGNIEAERARLGYTKSQMSEELGITLKTYAVYINGGAIPSDILEKLRDMTGKTIDYLLGIEDYVTDRAGAARDAKAEEKGA